MSAKRDSDGLSPGFSPEPSAGASVGVSPEAAPPDPSEESIWSRLQASGVVLPPDVIDKLAELDLELSEGEEASICRDSRSRRRFRRRIRTGHLIHT